MVVERIKEARYSFYNEQFDQVSQEAKDFISALLQKSPEFRLTASNALLHPWIKTLVQVGENSWPMARLDVSRLKTFNARRKWHVCLCTFLPQGLWLWHQILKLILEKEANAHTHTHTHTFPPWVDSLKFLKNFRGCFFPSRSAFLTYL